MLAAQVKAKQRLLLTSICCGCPSYTACTAQDFPQLMQMDPLAALQAEIKKRKSEQAASKQPSRRWRSQAEIELEREQQYYKRQKEADEDRQQTKRRRRFHDTLTASTATKGTANNVVMNASAETSNEKTYKADAASANSKDQQQVNRTVSTEHNNISNYDNKNDDDDDDKKNKKNIEEIPPLSKDDVIRKLRALKQPATLFGETDWTRFHRLRELQLSKDDHSDGQDNVYQKKMREVRAKDAAEDAIHFNSHDTKTVDEHDDDTGNSGSTKPSNDSGLISASSDVVIKGNVNNKKHDGTDNVNDATNCKEDFVHGFIRKYMRLWHGELEAMSKDERRSNKGRSQLATYEQTKDWLKPLEKLLRKRKLSKTILDALKDLFHAAAQREYMTAMRLYLERLAIGNAPWPMGATQVGIHSRAAREKIGEDKIAHVMNDEQTRKYIQAVKRLLTVAQRHFPTDASKSAST